MKTKTAVSGPTSGKEGTHASSASARDRGSFFRRAEDADQDTFFAERIQPKLRISRPGDRWEREADTVADAVVRGGDAGAGGVSQLPPVTGMAQRQAEEEEPLQMQPEEEEEPLQAQTEEEEPLQAQTEEEEGEEPIQAQMQTEDEEDLMPRVEEEEEEEPDLQARTAVARPPETSAQVEGILRRARGNGEPLPPPIRATMEARFGADFGPVRIHRGGDAARMNGLLRARALTQGSDIFFSDGRFAPDTREGRHLLAHELTHTIQQRAVGPRPEAVPEDGATVSVTDDQALGVTDGQAPRVEDDPALRLEDDGSGETSTADDGGAGDAADAGERRSREPEEPSSQEPGEPPSREPEEPGAAAEVDVELPEPPPPVAEEEAAPVEELVLEGGSEQATRTFIDASPSAMARAHGVLGEKVQEGLADEQQAAAEEPPVLEATTSGTVEEGITAADDIPVPAGAEVGDGVTGSDPGDLEAEEHAIPGAPPSNEAQERLLDRQGADGLLGWLQSNMRSFLAGIRTRDPALSTEAGERPSVPLRGESDVGRMESQREDATGELSAQRDRTTDTLRSHPGQQNVQPREVNEARAATPSPELSVTLETPEAQGATEYAEAPLPGPVRARTDELLAPRLESSLAEARTRTEKAARSRDTDKEKEIDRAKTEAARVNAEADRKQREIVLEKRGEVAGHQEEGIAEAYAKVDEFRDDADEEEAAAREEIGTKVDESEADARNELEKGEEDAEKEREEADRKAEAKRKELEEAQEEDSWWDRAVSAVKSAVKAITSAIDTIFEKVRAAVKTIIEAAKKAAVDLINKARTWVVDRLNRFREWAKGLVDEYLADHFPALAKRINGAIDAVVDVAVAGVNAVADQAIAAVEALADGLAAALDRVLAAYQTALKAAVQIAGAVVTGDLAEALRVAIQAACDLAGIDSTTVFDFLDRAGKRIREILGDPVGFINNLMEAVGGGVRSFAKNIRKHLVQGLVEWLTGALSDVPITLPDTFDVRGIFSLVMQILGLTYENIKAKIIKRFPPAGKVFPVLEKGFAIIKKLVTEGPMALWEDFKSKLSDLKETVLGGIREFVVTTVVKEGITWLLGLLNPAGALVKVLKLLYDFVMFLVERFQQIKDFVVSVYDSISAIAAGSLGKARKAVEDALARSLPVVIGLLASLAGLGGIGKTVKKIIRKVSRPVDKLLDKLIDKAVKIAKKLIAKGKTLARKAKEKVLGWWKSKKTFKGADGASHTLYFEGSGPTARLMVASKKWTYEAFLDWAGKDAEGKEKKALDKAKDVARKIDAAKKESVKGKTEAQEEANAKKKTEKIDGLLEQLRVHTSVLFGETLPPWQEPMYGAQKAGFGTSIHTSRITRIDMPDGSPPTQAAHGTYDKLDMRRYSSGASYYVRGHLLNDNLGGPGEWKNMTPLTRKGNSAHERQVESFVKKAVDSAAIMEYRVLPRYDGWGSDDPLATQVRKGLPEEDADVLEEVVRQERWVPTALECEAALLEPKGEDAFKKVSTKKWKVDNSLERTASAYHLEGGEKIEAVKINTLASAAPLKAQGMPQELADLADAIFAALQARRKDDAKPDDFGRYSTLAEETQGLTEEAAREWNEAGYIVL